MMSNGFGKKQWNGLPARPLTSTILKQREDSNLAALPFCLWAVGASVAARLAPFLGVPSLRRVCLCIAEAYRTWGVLLPSFPPAFLCLARLPSVLLCPSFCRVRLCIAEVF